MLRLTLALALAVVAIADQHVFTYVGYDHLLDYDPVNGNIRAFDFRRHLRENEQCDIFVYPPLIEKSKFIDVMTSAMDPDEVSISYLGNENFLVQDGKTGVYTIRRCSGFMPQQTRIPCEVWAVGRNDDFLSPNRYFYGGDSKVIRYNYKTQAFDLIFYDSDIHGGGYPFGKTSLVSAQFSAFPENSRVSFAFVTVKGPSTDLLVALNEDSGEFKVWKYNKNAEGRIDQLVGQMMMTGSILPKYNIKTMGEDNLIAYDRITGDFEVLKFVLVDGRLKVSSVKRDNIELGHGCIFDNRQECIEHSQCGWCGDSLTCHQLDSSRNPCDGTKCSNLVDQSSPEHIRYQSYETPNPSKLRVFGEEPANNPVSPLRHLHDSSANPILRANDLQDEKIMDSYITNPSEGIVYIPPKSLTIPCMDDDYIDPRDLPGPNITDHMATMNDFNGTAVPVSYHSPVGDATSQYAPPCGDSATPAAAIKNVTKSPALEAEEREFLTNYRPPENFVEAHDSNYLPPDDNTAREEDLMNGVLSHFSSLMPKGNDVAVIRPDALDTALPPTSKEIIETTFKPAEGNRWAKRVTVKEALQPTPPEFDAPPVDKTIPIYDDGQMDEGVRTSNYKSSGAATSYEPFDHTQMGAMINSDNTLSMLNPPVTAPQLVSEENHHDLTGLEPRHEPQLEARPDSVVIEGHDLPTVSLDKAQVAPAAASAIVAPEPEIDTATEIEKFEAKQAVAAATAQEQLVYTPVTSGLVDSGDMERGQ